MILTALNFIASMTELRTAINTQRAYYGLTAYTWGYTLEQGKTNAAYWVYHVQDLRAAVQGVIDKLNEYGANITVAWLPLGTGRPRADLMNQLRDTIQAL
jgi:hypothetical protein